MLEHTHCLVHDKGCLNSLMLVHQSHACSSHDLPPHWLLLLQLKTSLQNGDVIMVPPIKEAQKLLQAYVKNVAESSRSFVRWMDGTCLEMADQRAKGDTDGDPLVMHFSSEVIRMQQVCTQLPNTHCMQTKAAGHWIKWGGHWIRGVYIE